jgi:hypothetical protein
MSRVDHGDVHNPVTCSVCIAQDRADVERVALALFAAHVTHRRRGDGLHTTEADLDAEWQALPMIDWPPWRAVARAAIAAGLDVRRIP